MNPAQPTTSDNGTTQRSAQDFVVQNLERRNKRLEFWAKSLSSKEISRQYLIQINEMLTTYRLLISRLCKTQNDKDYNDTETRIIDLERNFVSLFEEKRCATSPLVK